MCWFAGMPYPHNLRTALEVEGIVRSQGAVPATIAIIDGRPCIGAYICQWRHLALRPAFQTHMPAQCT
jgi:pseudouridine-5'-phosphate glycosidase